MAAASLAHYDGTAGTLVDTNVWVDCIDERSPWHDWAMEQLQVCSERSPLHVNIIIYSELLIPGPDVQALDALLDVYDTLRSPLPWAAAHLAAVAYSVYRRNGGARQTPLPDFFIGAHAAVSNLSVLTRDPKPYRSYFARLKVLAPDAQGPPCAATSERSSTSSPRPHCIEMHVARARRAGESDEAWRRSFAGAHVQETP